MKSRYRQCERRNLPFSGLSFPQSLIRDETTTKLVWSTGACGLYWHVRQLLISIIDFVLQTVGELFLILSEMGFTEEQIQAAMQAGHFSVPDAAEWWVDPELFLSSMWLLPFSNVLFTPEGQHPSVNAVSLSHMLIGSCRVSIHGTGWSRSHHSPLKRHLLLSTYRKRQQALQSHTRLPLEVEVWHQKIWLQSIKAVFLL